MTRIILSFFQLCKNTLTIAVFAQLAIIHAALLLENFPFDRVQQIIRGVIQQFSFGLRASLCCRFHIFSVLQKQNNSIPNFIPYAYPVDSRSIWREFG